MQALTTLNEVIFTECARALARRTLDAAGPSEAERIATRFARASAAQPSEAERAVLVELLHKQLQRIAEGWTERPRDRHRREQAAGRFAARASTPAQLAAYTVVARVILNLDETITKE